MCEDWLNSFEAFFASMGPAPKNTSLDRIDVNGNYEPSNCRWATNAEQARNRTDNVWVNDGEERMVLKDFAAKHGVPYKRLQQRIKLYGMTAHEALAAG